MVINLFRSCSYIKLIQFQSFRKFTSLPSLSSLSPLVTFTLACVNTNSQQIRTMSSASVVESCFPSVALLPKKETTALSFINRYPEYDGRKVVIAIFDTGIDPGAPGLQVTSDGKPKIIDIISASNESNVDTSTVVIREDGNDSITGLTGRKLKIPSSWSNPTGKWHLGVKNGYELYPSEPCNRIKAEYQRNNWSSSFQDAKAKSLREFQEFEEKEKADKKKTNTEQKDAAESTTVVKDEGSESIVFSDKTLEQQLIKEDLQAKVDAVNSMEENYDDLGPTYDCIVFHDGSMWRACIDVTQTGDLEKCDILGSYRETFKYATLTERDQLNYSVTIHDDGNLLEINCINGDHGTHVAAITAANFPDEPEKNGIAPGAQLISINIANHRLGGNMETGSSIIKACNRAIEAKVDVINMSFGEPASWIGGRVMDFMNEVVRKHGIVFVTACGNSGPSLSTVNGSSFPSSIMSIGAYVSPEMMEAEYSTREKMPGRILTFSSKDPDIGGGQSVSVCAPGAAIASVSRATLAKCELFNGTSMAAPNAAGGVALVISGMKQKNYPYSPFSVRRSFENTALKPPTYDPFAMGHGLMQVEPAFEHCAKFSNSIERDVRFNITCSGSKKGIYLREEVDIVRPSVHVVSIEPFFLNNDNYDNAIKGDFEMKLCLTCDAPWVQIPSFLLVTNCKRNIVIKVDPTGLSPGSHNTSLKAYDSSFPDKGFIFTVPITVIKPTDLDTNGSVPWRQLDLKPGVSHFTHIIPPTGSSVAIIKIRNSGTVPTGSCFINLRQLAHQGFGKNLKKDFNLNPGAETTITFPIWHHKTVDIAVTKWWSSIGDSTINYMIEFGGTLLDTPNVTMLSSSAFHKVEMFGNIPLDHVQPKILLTHVVSPLKPVDDIISPLTSRDILPEGRQIYGLNLTYNFNLPKAVEVTCLFPLLATLVYESEYDSHVWMIFNANKQFMLAGEAVPERKSYKLDRYCKKLEKGDYTIKLQICHDNPSHLKKVSKLPVHLITKLASSVSLDVYASYRDLLIEGKQFGSRTIEKKQQLNAYIKSIPADKLPKNLPNTPGSYLYGTIVLAKDENRKKSEEYEFHYILDGEAPKKSANGKDISVKDKPVEEQYKEALIDFKAEWIAKHQGKSHEALLVDIADLKPEKKHIIDLAKIQALSGVKDESLIEYDKIIELANEVIDAQKTDDLCGSLLFAKNRAKIFNDEQAKKDEQLKNLEKQKDRLAEALYHKGLAILYLLKKDQSAPSSGEVNEQKETRYTIRQVDEIILDLKKLDEINNVKWHKLVYQHAIAKGHYGRALKAVMKQMENKQTKELEEELMESYRRLGWNFAAQHVKRSQLVRYPLAYRSN